MAYDERLADRVHTLLAGAGPVTEKAMFGGLAFMVDGNMVVGISGDELMVRVGPDRHDEALAQPHARVFDMTGRPMRGWLLVAPAGVAGDADLRAWVERALEFARTLPPK